MRVLSLDFDQTLAQPLLVPKAQVPFLLQGLPSFEMPDYTVVLDPAADLVPFLLWAATGAELWIVSTAPAPYLEAAVDALAIRPFLARIVSLAAVAETRHYPPLLSECDPPGTEPLPEGLLPDGAQLVAHIDDQPWQETHWKRTGVGLHARLKMSSLLGPGWRDGESRWLAVPPTGSLLALQAQIQARLVVC